MTDTRVRPASAATAALLAVVATAIAVGARWLLDPWLADGLALVTLPAAVAAALWFGDWRHGVLVAVLGYLACDVLFIGPPGRLGSPTREELVGTGAYLLTCGFLVAFGQAMRAARLRAHEGQESLRVTLASIGDAVIATDTAGRVTWLNPVAEALTGWNRSEAVGRPLETVLRLLNEATRAPVASPAERALREGRVVGLANHTLLVGRDGTERPIDDSAAPIRDESGRVDGCVLVFRDVTERRRADAALRRSERELVDFFETATIGLHWVGPDGTFLRVNQAELDLLGYERSDVVGRPVEDFYEDPAVVRGVFTEIRRGETVRERPARVRRKDGTVRDVLVSSSALFEGGEFVHSRCFTIDVTDRKRAEEARAQLAAIVAASDDAIVSKTLEGVIRSWNAGAERVFGYTAAEAVGQSIELVIPPELRSEEQTILERLRRGERIDHFETERVAKDGRRIRVSLTVSPVRDETGRIVGASKIARDVTEREQSRAAFQASEVRYRALVESQSELVCRFRPDGTVLFANRAYARARGRTPAELEGTSFWEYVASEERAEVRAMLDAMTPENPEVRIENGFDTVEGRRWILWTNRALSFDEAGRVVEAQSTGVDITERRRAEAELRESDRRKTEFLAMLAHELRNPLAPIRNSLELLERGDADAALDERARATIGRQLAHLVRLVDDLLDVSRITRDRLELRTSRVDLASILHQAVETCRPLAQCEAQDVELALPDRPVPLEADPVRLAQVFSNLLDNACKYTPRGGRIRVTAAVEDGEAVVVVADDGLGIPPAELETIFDMFVQVGPTPELSRGGLGLGLTLVKRLVEMHGGRVAARSAGAGRGSEFEVRLPLAAAPAADSAAESPAGASAAADSAAGDEPAAEREPAEPVPTGPRRILVVDDNTDSAASLAALLDLDGHETATAFDGLEALTAVEERRPEIILLDIGLPKLDGYEVCRRLRALPGGSELVVVALTGWGQAEDRRRSREAGFDAHLVKPIDLDDLKRVIAGHRE